MNIKIYLCSNKNRKKVINMARFKESELTEKLQEFKNKKNIELEFEKSIEGKMKLEEATLKYDREYGYIIIESKNCKLKINTTLVTGYEKIKDEYKKKLKVTNKNSSIKSETYDDIFDEFGNDEVVIRLRDTFKSKSLEKPDYEWVDFDVEGQTGYADLLWEKKKLLLFASDNQEGYAIAKQSDYKCYLLDVSFNIDDFLSDFSEE